VEAFGLRSLRERGLPSELGVTGNVWYSRTANRFPFPQGTQAERFHRRIAIPAPEKKTNGKQSFRLTRFLLYINGE
jgi:hypothetical protein